jgi:hypothetical protein
VKTTPRECPDQALPVFRTDSEIFKKPTTRIMASQVDINLQARNYDIRSHRLMSIGRFSISLTCDSTHHTSQNKTVLGSDASSRDHLDDAREASMQLYITYIALNLYLRSI